MRRVVTRTICWLWHRSTWKLMGTPHGRVQVYEWGCRRCACVWYEPVSPAVRPRRSPREEPC